MDQEESSSLTGIFEDLLGLGTNGIMGGGVWVYPSPCRWRRIAILLINSNDTVEKESTYVMTNDFSLI